MRITDIGIIVDVVCDVYEKLHNVKIMREIPDADILKLFEDDTTSSTKH